jgi:hypothetical protein
LKRTIIFLVACLVVLFPGCKRSSQITDEKPVPSIKKMMNRTDIVLVRHFYEKQQIGEDQAAKFPDVHPGYLTLVPIWVYEPGKEKDGQKGASVSLDTSWMWTGEAFTSRRDGGDERTAFLDLKELRDLDSALDFFESNASPWRKQVSGDHVEVAFESKDDFRASIFHSTGDSGDVLYLTIDGKSIALNTGKVSELQKITRDAIAKLDKL